MTDLLTKPEAGIPDAGVAPPDLTPPPTRRSFRWLGWMSLIVAMLVLAVGAIVLLQGDDGADVETFPPTASDVIVEAPTGYWNAYTREWVPFAAAPVAAPYEPGYWNAYTREWVTFDPPYEPGYWNAYTREWVTFDSIRAP